jgi:hypothetical protein
MVHYLPLPVTSIMTSLICRSVLQILLRGTGTYVVFGQKADNYPTIFSHRKIYYVLYLRQKTDEDIPRTSRKELRSTEVMILLGWSTTGLQLVIPGGSVADP